MSKRNKETRKHMNELHEYIGSNLELVKEANRHKFGDSFIFNGKTYGNSNLLEIGKILTMVIPYEIQGNVV